MKFPLTEHALEGALGVLVHTTQAYEHLRRVLSMPIVYAPLPFRACTRFEASSSAARVAPPVRLVIFGYLGSNRRVDRVLTALATMSVRTDFSLDIYGIIGRNSEFERLVKSVKPCRVKIHGFVSEAELNRALSSAHIAINLRYPSMGEASGSQLRIWSHALPSLVSEVGWYASLPRDAVRVVRPGEHEIEDIQKHLGDFLEDPEEFRRMGERGYAHLLSAHSPQRCVDAIVELACRANRAPGSCSRH
jgi:glycosyltransferase involved in cell wall biosynthesis